jgi:hypothetical protein
MASCVGVDPVLPPYSLALTPRRAPPAFARRSGTGFLGRAAALVAHALDRSDERVRAWQDLAVNATLFAVAVWAMHKHGHKLAV